MTTIVEKFESQPVTFFKTGKYATNAGVMVEFDTEVLDGIVEEYNSRSSENLSPGTVNHPGTRGADPYAYTWAREIQRNGNTLEAYFQDSDVEFVENIRAKKLKNRSVGLRLENKKYVLDHVSFLGSSSPRIKGMPEINLSNEGMDVITLSNEDTDIVVELDIAGDDFINNDMKTETEKSLMEFFAPAMAWFKKQSGTESETDKEEEIEMKDKDLKVELSEAQEKITELETALEASTAELDALKQSVELDARKNKVAELIDKQVKNGKITPADKEKYTELAMSFDENQEKAFVELMDAKEAEINLGEDAPVEDYDESLENADLQTQTHKIIELTKKYQKEDGLELIEAHQKAVDEIKGK